MSQRQVATFNNSGILLTLLASLYYFTLQPWAILARSVIVVLTLIMSKATPEKDQQLSQQTDRPGDLILPMERKTKRAVSIETAHSDQNLAKCNAQSRSPLFYKLPQELRDYIFELSCTQTEVVEMAYDQNSYWYRPGYTAPLRTYTSLLQTCRRIWLEANSLPMRQAEHAFWFQRGPHDRHPDAGWRANVQNERDRYSRLFEHLTTNNLSNVSHIRLFMQMFQADELKQAARMAVFFPRTLVQKGFKPKRFTVTIRSVDWWNWEENQALSLPGGWVQSMLDSPFLGGIDELALDLEAEDRKADQLDAIIRQIKELQGKPKLVDLTGSDRSKASKFVPQDSQKSMRWTRSPRINNENHDTYEGMTVLPLRATTLVWKNTPCDAPDPPPEPAYIESSGLTERIVGAPGLTLRNRGPLHLVWRSPAQRERLRSGGWMAGRFPEVLDDLWSNSVRHANRWERIERERFEQMMGDIEAQRLQMEWEKKGILLRFVGLPA